MSDDLASLMGVGGGATLVGYLAKKLVDRTFGGEDKWRNGVENSLSQLAAGQAAMATKIELLVQSQSTTGVTHDGLKERIEKGLEDHKSRLHQLERQVTFLEGRDEGYRQGLEAIAKEGD